MENDHLSISVDKAKRLVEIIASRNSGDSLNHVNTVTAFDLYLEANHPAFDGLYESILCLPASHGADAFYDVLLRFSAASLLRQEAIIDSHGIIDSSIGLRNGSNSQKYDIDYLLRVWRKNPLCLCRDHFSTFLFGQYAQRLHSNCGLSLNENEKSSIIYQMLGFVPELFNKYTNEQMSELRVISRLMLSASTIARLEDIKTTKILLGHAISLLEKVNPNEITLNDFDDICFIGLNIYYLRDFFDKLMNELSQSFIRPNIYTSQSLQDYEYRNPRNLALRLFGIRCVLSEKETIEIAKEFSSTVEFSGIMQIRNILKSAITMRHTFREKLKEMDFSFDKITPENIHRFIQKIKPNRSKIVLSPLRTLEEGGDCKSIAVIVALLLLEANLDGNICLFYGQDINIKNDNHVYIEIVVRQKDERIPIDITPGFGKHNSCITNKDAITKYPITRLIENSENEIIHDFSADRSRIRQACTRK